MSRQAYILLKQLAENPEQPVEGAPEVEALRKAMVARETPALVAAAVRCVEGGHLPHGFVRRLLEQRGVDAPLPISSPAATTTNIKEMPMLKKADRAAVVKKPCGCAGKTAARDGAAVTRPSCLECVEKHLGAAWVLIAEHRDGYPHRLRAIGHLHEAEDESQAWPELHNAIRAARKAYQQTGATPDFIMLAQRIGLLAAGTRVTESDTAPPEDASRSDGPR